MNPVCAAGRAPGFCFGLVKLCDHGFDKTSFDNRLTDFGKNKSE
jgi:hypothetical protein